MIPIYGLLIAIHSETALAQTTLWDKRHADFRPDLDHEPDIYPGLGLPSLLRLLCCSVSLRGAQPSKLAEPMISVASCANQSGDGLGEHWRLPGGAMRTRRRALRRCRRIDEAR